MQEREVGGSWLVAGAGGENRGERKQKSSFGTFLKAQ